MKPLIIIGVVLLIAVVIAGFWLKRMAQGAKVVIIIQRLGQFSAELKKQGSFTNDIPHLCDIYPFTDSVTLNGTPHRCTLAAKSPLFADSGVMAITIDDTVVWIDRDGRASAINGPDSVTP